MSSLVNFFHFITKEIAKSHQRFACGAVLFPHKHDWMQPRSIPLNAIGGATFLPAALEWAWYKRVIAGGSSPQPFSFAHSLPPLPPHAHTHTHLHYPHGKSSSLLGDNSGTATKWTCLFWRRRKMIISLVTVPPDSTQPLLKALK
jgi:hypothetical protein